MADIGDFIEQVRRANALDDVMNETGGEWRLQQRGGRYLRGMVHDSLVVDTELQYYVYNSTGERGDVFAFVQKHWSVGGDFMGALEALARRAGLEMPVYRRDDQDVSSRLLRRHREDVWEVGLRWMQRQLWNDAEALGYVRGRGWDDDAIRLAGLGFTGREGTDDLRRELVGEGVNIESAAAVALVGWRGDVAGWARANGVEPQDNWLSWGLVPGLVHKTRLVYPHMEAGRVRYISARNILGAQFNNEGREIKSYNLPVALAGKRTLYYNQAYMNRANECVLVEGQADAISWGMAGVAAVALAGTAWKDHGEELAYLRQRHTYIYIGLDGDQAGTKALVGRDGEWPLRQVFGPMVRVVRPAERNGQAIKDMNDVLQYERREWAAKKPGGGAGEGPEDFAPVWAKKVKAVMESAPTMVEEMARWAGAQKGAARDGALTVVFAAIAGLDKTQRSTYRTRLCDLMDIGVREYNDILKAVEVEAKAQAAEEAVETFGGYIGGWLLDYVYDPETETARLVWRDADRNVGMGETVTIDGRTYRAKTPSTFVKNGGVLFPSGLGELRTTRQLAEIIERFVKRNYLLENAYMGRIIAYYVLLTWVYDAFDALCYLRAMGEAGSGKSELMRRVGHLCYRLLPASGASTSASFFRATEMFKGTVFIDEADLHDGGDMSNELVKFLNLGAMKGNNIWRLAEVTSAMGGRDFELTTFNTFGPKLIAMRKDFRDDAVGTRALTLKLMPREPIELKQAGIRLNIDDDFRADALKLRNMLLRWRLEVWEPHIDTDDDDMDLEISSRLNQVTMPLKALAKGDPELRAEIERFLRAYNQEMVLTRSMTIAARVVEAMWSIRTEPERQYMMSHTPEGDAYMFVGDVRKVANEIMDRMNEVEQEQDGDKKKRRKDELTARGVGSIVRNELQLHVGNRRGDGFPVYWDEIKMQALARRYGIETPEPDRSNGHHDVEDQDYEAYKQYLDMADDLDEEV